MFKKYTALAAAMMIASSAAIASAECVLQGCSATSPWACQDIQACNTTSGCFCTTCSPINATCDQFCTTCGHTNSTCDQFCTTCWDCASTCGTACNDFPMPEPTAIPLPLPTMQPTQQPSATQAPSTGDDYTTQSVSAQEQKMVNLLNQDRKNNGRTALTIDPELCRIARIKSADMRDNRYFAHESPTYGRVGEMLRHFGYRFSAAGENIAHHANVDKAQAAFMSSQGHRQNILSQTWTKMGIGIVTDANGYIYATQIFAK